MAEKDITSKTLESYNSVFADIVNCLLFNGETIIKENELTPAEKSSQYKADGNIYSQERDVSKFWMNSNINIAFIGIENQSSPDEFMPIRIMNYDSAVYRDQYKNRNKNNNNKCYPVITLVIYFGNNDWKYGKNLHSCLNVPEKLSPFVSDYRMNFYSIKDMPPEKIELFKSDFKAIAEFFYALNNRTVYHPTEQILKYPEEVIDMISVFSGDARFRNEYNSMIKQGGINMCEIYDQILKEGEKKGRAEGRTEGFLKALIELVKDGILSLSDAAKRAGMTVEEFEARSGLKA